MRWLRAGFFLASVLAMVPAAQIATVQAADAGRPPIAITATVNLRSVPTAQNNEPLAEMPAGSRPQYICYVHGQNIKGTDVWFRVSWQGVVGYYTSYYDDVPLAKQANLQGYYGIPQCGTGTDINQMPRGSTAVAPPSRGTHNGSVAASWALAHAKGPMPTTWGGCTWFVSQALWYGGLNRTGKWHDNGERGFVRKTPGTSVATAAPDLSEYLVVQGYAGWMSITSRLTTNAVPEARVGDVLAYDWEGTEDDKSIDFSRIDHLAMVVAIAPGDYPEVAEWGTNKAGNAYIAYQKRGWTWSYNDNDWLQVRHASMSVYLFRMK